MNAGRLKNLKSKIANRKYLSSDLWGLPLFITLFAITFTLFVFLVTIYESIGQDILPYAGIFIFLSAIFWLIDPFLKERLSIAVANVTLIAIYLICAQVLLVVSDGLQSQFFLVYYFVIFTGAISYGLSGAIAVTALVAIAYATFIEDETQFPRYIVQMVVLWIIAMMVGFLAETKRRVERHAMLQNLRLTALSEIARFMRELSKPGDVLEAGLDAAVRLLGAETAVLVVDGRIRYRAGKMDDESALDRGQRFEIEFGSSPNEVIILRAESLSQDETRIMRLLIEKMQLIWTHLADRAAIEAAREEKERIMDSIDSAVVTVNPGGEILTANRKAVEILGFDLSRLIGKKIQAPPFSVPALGEFGGEAREIQIGAATEKIPVEMRVIPKLDESGVENGAIIVFNDLKELRRLKAIIHRSEALAAVGEMSARVAHEIRNPLGGILGFLGLAERKATDDVIPYLNEAKEGVKRLERVVSDLLTFARPLGGLTSAFLLKDAWTKIEKEERARETAHVRLAQVNIEPLPSKLSDVRLKGDSAHFDRVMGNLLRNAREAAGENGAVAMRVRWGDPTVWIEVDDDGPGVPPELTEKIFEPFVSTKEDGSGLGLAITRRIIEELGGGIKSQRVRDASGKTVTRFRIAWPRAEG